MLLLDPAALLGELGNRFGGFEDFGLELLEVEHFLFLKVSDGITGGGLAFLGSSGASSGLTCSRKETARLV